MAISFVYFVQLWIFQGRAFSDIGTLGMEWGGRQSSKI